MISRLKQHASRAESRSAGAMTPLALSLSPIEFVDCTRHAQGREERLCSFSSRRRRRSLHPLARWRIPASSLVLATRDLTRRRSCPRSRVRRSRCVSAPRELAAGGDGAGVVHAPHCVPCRLWRERRPPIPPLLLTDDTDTDIRVRINTDIGRLYLLCLTNKC